MSTIQSTAQIQPTNAANVVEIQLKEETRDSGGYPQTNWLPIRRVPLDHPLSLKAGDEVFVAACEQIDNEASAPAGDPWMQTALVDVRLIKRGSIQQQKKRPYHVAKVPTYELEEIRASFNLDPRRTMPVMVEVGVWRTTSPHLIGGGRNVVTNRGFNLDNTTHHGPWEGFKTDFVTADFTGYYLTAVRFAWSVQFMPAGGAKMEVLDRGMLSARVEGSKDG